MTQKPKKIAIIYSGAKHWGGVETYLELLFANADRAKVNLTLLSLGSWPLTRKLPNAEYRVRTLDSGRFRVRTIFEMAKCLREDDIDLVVSQGTVANAYARAASLLSGVPILVVVHSDLHFDYPNPFVRAIYSIIEGFTRFPTKQYIAVSEYLKKKLVDSGIPVSRITVIYNGVTENPVIPVNTGISPDPRDPPSLGYGRAGKHEDDTIVIGSIGRLHKVKNYPELIRACSELKTEDWKLVIIGDGKERANLEKLIAELGIRDNVELRGDVKNAREQLEQIDIYVQPSLSEGFGLTVVEAMLAGKPVIVSPCGSLPELVENGKTGIVMKGTSYSDIANAINELIADKDKANKLAIAGQKYALENFSVEKWIAEIENAYIQAAK